jgi:hypothetical protein
MKKAFLIILITSLILFLYFFIKTRIENEKVAINSNTVKLLSRSLVCELPCWQYITPSVTKFGNATSILQNKNISITFANDESIEANINNEVFWSINKRNNDTVHFIRVSIKSMKLGDLLLALDALPEEVFVIPHFETRKNCNASLFLYEKGMILDLFPENKSKDGCEVDFTYDTQISTFILIGQDNINSFYKGTSKMKWEGYGTYP